MHKHNRSRILIIAALAHRDPRTVQKALADPNSVSALVSAAVQHATREADRIYPVDDSAPGATPST